MLRYYATLLFIILSLSGCAAVLLGGGAAGGYYMGTDERTLGEMTDDATITTKIKAKYVNDDAVPTFDVHVSAYKGDVTLRGTVNSVRAKERAIKLAKDTYGVKSVTSKLKVIPSS